MDYEISPTHVGLQAARRGAAFVAPIKMLIERDIEKYLRIVVPMSADTFTDKR